MKRFLSCILVVFSLVAFASCVSMVKTRHVGKPITVNIPLRDFNNIDAAGSLNVYFTQADSFSVRVVAPKEMIDEMNVYVTAPSLNSTSLAGSGDFIIDAPLKTSQFKASLAGSGDINVKDLDAQSLDVSLAGSGDVNVNARQLDKLKASVAGSGDIDLKVTSCNVANLNVAGSGDITRKGTVKQLNKNVAGSGDINVSK